MKNLTKILASITLSVIAFTGFGNELTNGDFELNPPTAYGNNTYHSVAPWGFSGSGYSNVVHVDGPGGSEGYGKNGPDSDATNSGAGVWRNYLDIVGSGTVYQSFTTPEKCSGEVRFGGFFSTRGNSTGTAQIEIRNGTGLSGALVGTTANIFLDRGDSKNDPWTPVNFSTTLSAGTTYTLVVTMSDTLNFDEAYVNFVDGPCEDDSDVVDDEPKQCLILEPKVECIANKWQVSINNNSTNFNADVLEITSQTPGVTISGSSPNWILEGALPNSSVDITVDGTVTGGGKADFADLCCTTKLHIVIPDEICEIVQEKPHIYTRKVLEETEDGKDYFKFIQDSLVQINDPIILSLTDTIPSGVTLTSLDSSNTTDWSCPGLPLAGPATLVCTYIGSMPIPAGWHNEIILYADIESSKEIRENCVETAFHKTNGDEVSFDGPDESCVEIPAEDKNDEDLPKITTTKTCVFPPRFGSAQYFNCTITVTASNLSGNGDINLSDIVTDTGATGITGFTSSDNWQCDTPPVNSPTPYNCSLSESDLLSSGGTSEIQISGYTVGSASTMDNCAINIYTDSEGNSTESNEACLSTNNEDDTEECSPPNILIEGHCELPCENDSQCSSIEGAACLPFYNTETLVCQQSEIECAEGEVLVEGVCVTDSSGEPPLTLEKQYIRDESHGTVKHGFGIRVIASSPINAPSIIQVTDTLPAGVTLNALMAGTDWNCPGLPITGPTTLTCNYIGPMPLLGESVLFFSSTILPSESPRQNCSGLSVLANEGATPVSIDNLPEHCADIPVGDPSNSSCDAPKVILYGHCVLPCVTNSQCVNEGELCLDYGDDKVCQTVPSITQVIKIDKSAPKTCKAGEKCKFTFTITNKTKKPYIGFVGITDKPNKRFGRIRGKSKGWSCKKKGREYRCGVNKLSLKSGEAKTLSLTLQVPRRLAGKVENCASLQAEDVPVSPKSCVTVEIINDRKCGYDDKLVNGRCVARCKSRNSNWNGIDCMVCRNGKTWNDRYKRCDKKSKEVMKSCPHHYAWSSSKKRCVYVVPKIEQPKQTSCNKGTHYDSRKKRCVENARPPKCNKGTHYDAGMRRCIENKRSHPKGCPAGQIYLSDVRRCVKVNKETPKSTGGPSSCGDGMLWNIGYQRCDTLIIYDDGDDHDGGGHP